MEEKLALNTSFLNISEEMIDCHYFTLRITIEKNYCSHLGTVMHIM